MQFRIFDLQFLTLYMKKNQDEGGEYTIRPCYKLMQFSKKSGKN